MTLLELEALVPRIFGEAGLPKPLHLLRGLQELRNGTTIQAAARMAGTTAALLKRLADASGPVAGRVAELPDPISQLLGERPSDFEAKAAKVRATIGQLIIGNLAERVFERIYRETVGSAELRLEDDRSSGGDTDYLVRNGQDRQVFRLNIKFHGSQFRKARDLVGLEPENCFALATYKIYSALQKQDREHLPYIFVVVGVPNLTGSSVGAIVPEDIIEFATYARYSGRVAGRRRIENVIVSAMIDRPTEFGVADMLAGFERQIQDAPWKVLSARRANELLREKLFERAFALRVRGFAMNYRGAELDMHFSIAEDLHPLEELLQVLRDGGLPALISRLERGTF